MKAPWSRDYDHTENGRMENNPSCSDEVIPNPNLDPDVTMDTYHDAFCVSVVRKQQSDRVCHQTFTVRITLIAVSFALTLCPEPWGNKDVNYLC